MDLQLNGKRAVVTGAASGIGRATAIALAAEGVHTVLADINDAGQQTATDIADAGGVAHFIQTDTTDAKAVQAMVDAAVTTFGGLDIAVNNVGIPQNEAPVHETTEEHFTKLMTTNVHGTFLCMRAEIPAMLASGGGAIVNLSSICGLTSFAGGATYAATKHAVLGLTRGAALDYATQNIRINCVNPGTIKTPMLETYLGRELNEDDVAAFVGPHPIGRMGRPEEVANAIVWLVSDAASFVLGAPISVDGGFVAQ